MRDWAATPGRGVIFDFNGTLSDDEPILEQIFIDLFTSHLGWPMAASYYREKLLGMSDREIVEHGVREHGAGDLETIEHLLSLRSHEYRSRVATRCPISTEAIELVHRLHLAGVPMAIVTGAQLPDVRAVIDSCAVGSMISVVVAEEDVHHGKPEPEGFLQGAARLGLRPQDILAFEDSLPGATAAARAGMLCIAVTGESLAPSPAMRAVVAAHIDRLGTRVLAGLNL